MYVQKMRNNSKTQNSLRSLAIVWVLGVQGIAGVADTTFSCDPKAELDKSFNITCNIIGTIVIGIQWTRPDDTSVTGCSDTNNCVTIVPGYAITTATKSENVLHIAKVGIIDIGKWTCQDGPGSKGCEIIVQKTPTTALTILSTKKIYSVGDKLEVSVDVQGYFCSRAPSFHLLLDSQRVELDALPSTPSVILSGTQSKSINVTEEMTGSIKLAFNCRDDDVLPDEKTFRISAITTDPPKSTSATTTTTVTTTTTKTTTSPTFPTLYVIVGSVVGVVLLAVFIGVCCYCVRRNPENKGNAGIVELKHKDIQTPP